MIKTLMTMGASYILFNPNGQKIGKEMLKQVNALGIAIMDDVKKEVTSKNKEEEEKVNSCTTSEKE